MSQQSHPSDAIIAEFIGLKSRLVDSVPSGSVPSLEEVNAAIGKAYPFIGAARQVSRRVRAAALDLVTGLAVHLPLEEKEALLEDIAWLQIG